MKRATIGLALLFVLCPLSFVLLAADAPPSDSSKSDAQLTDVSFVDPQHGWAVGDRGAIWYTDDAGAHWQAQDSTVDCRLTAVQFLDAKNGWAAGGSTQPYTHATTGVVLKTSDGGQHWETQPTWLLPALNQIKFLDARRGWAVARSSSLFPSGLFVTERGGRDWAPVVGETAQASFLDWTAADFGPRTGLAISADGTEALLRGQVIEPARATSFGLGAARQVQLTSEKTGWLAGDGGLVMQTTDGGRTWQSPAAPLPATARQFDFTSIQVRGDKIWIAGSPGSRLFTSDDGGRTWLDYPTGQALPIRALNFLDDDRGWCVGDLGTILSTRDGGHSWQRQQNGGTRAGVLGIFCEAEDVPLELFARLSAGEGYFAHVALVNRADLESPSLSASTLPRRAHEALAGIGVGSTDQAWQFPIRNRQIALPAARVVEAWGDGTDDHLAALDAYLVRLIRTWRPDIVVTHDTSPRGDDPLAYLVDQAVLRAIDAAAAPITALGDAASRDDAGLEPWRVKKVYGMLPPGQGGGINVTPTEMAARSGRSLAELTWRARGLVNSEFKSPPASVGFRPLVDHLPQDAGRGDFLVGLPDARGESRRRVGEVPRDNIDTLRRSAQKRRNLQAMLARTAQDPSSAARWFGGVSDLVGELDEATAGEFIFELAQRFAQTGQWELAADTFALIPKRYPKHPLAPAALVWLVHYYSSDEMSARLFVKRQYGILTAAGHPPVAVPAGSGVVAAEATTPVTDDGSDWTQARAKRAAQAVAFAADLEKLAPAVFAEPQFHFSLAAAARGSDNTRESEKYFQSLRRSRPQDAWFASAAGEEWLASGRGAPTKSVWRCVRASTKPRLDGQLDDEVWKQAKPIELRSPLKDDADWPSVAMLAYDDEFLYVGIRCRQAPGLDYAPGEGPRRRDADLTHHDRVELLIDLDRDYATFDRLTVDHRGWTRDECWNDASWNPTWYVAASADEETWTVEAAIPLTELTRQPPDGKTVWAVGLQRIVPGVGFQSWTTPASCDVIPEGFGYLTFEQ